VHAGEVLATNKGTPQGAVILPLLANIYLQYVYDLRIKRWQRREANGEIIVVRHADDTVVGFQHEANATRLLVNEHQLAPRDHIVRRCKPFTWLRKAAWLPSGGSL
jgi:retron-type reverse transcriptase